MRYSKSIKMNLFNVATLRRETNRDPEHILSSRVLMGNLGLSMCRSLPKRCTPLDPALWRQKQVDLCEFQASLVYVSSSTESARAI